jgi:SAM-dependent methyltransferase
MSAVLARSEPPFPAEQRLDWLLGNIATNRFLPAPPVELKFCGDGDYRAIGAEFLGHFVRMADLRPYERVLDIGCGVGRMAVPLTQFLSDTGTYDGIDVVRKGVAWCERTISPAYPNFRFQHLDLDHPLYNPEGSGSAEQVRLPFADASFDFICLISVLTHLDTAVLTNYASEVARLLAPGGRCFATAFLITSPAREALRSGRGRLAFDPDAEGPEFYADPGAPLAAIAFDEDHFLEKFFRFERRRRRTPVYGCWSGRHSAAFQHICIFE